MKAGFLFSFLSTFLIICSLASRGVCEEIKWNRQEGEWTLPENWEAGRVPGEQDNAIIDNGGIARLSGSSLKLANLKMLKGGLTLGNGGKLTVNSPVSPADMIEGAEFTISLREGKLEYGNNVYWGVPMGTRIKAFLEGEDEQVNVPKHDFLLSHGEISIKGGGIRVPWANNWFYVSSLKGGKGKITIEGHPETGKNGRITAKRVVLCSHNNVESGELIVKYGGVIDAPVEGIQGFYKESPEVERNPDCKAILRLEKGSRAKIRRIYSDISSHAPVQLYIDGGRIEYTKDSDNYGISFKDPESRAWIQTNGVIFSVNNGLRIKIPQPLLEDPASSGGGIVKEGAGTLYLTGTNNLTGNLEIKEGWLDIDSVNPNFSGDIICGGVKSGKITVKQGADRDAIMSGALISPTGTGIFAKGNTGLLTLTGPLQAFHGTIRANGGILELKGKDVCPSDARIEIYDTGILRWSPTSSAPQILETEIISKTTGTGGLELKGNGMDRPLSLTRAKGFLGNLVLHSDTCAILSRTDSKPWTFCRIKAAGPATLRLSSTPESNAEGNLVLSTLQINLDGMLTLEAGEISVPQGSLAVEIPRPVKKGHAKVLQVRKECWKGGIRPEIRLLDTEGQPISRSEAHAYYAGNILCVDTEYPTLLLLN